MHYRLSGHVVASDLPLDLPPADGDPSVWLTLGPLALRPEPEWVYRFEQDGVTWLAVGRTTDGLELRYPGLARFAVDSDAERVRVEALGDTPPETIRHLFLSQVWPMVLTHRGALVLHASAVVVDGGAVAFFGESGWGKSTIALALARAGHAFVTDDLLLVEPNDGAYIVQPGAPEHRLWADTVGALGHAPGERAAHYTPKRRTAAASAATEPVPLRAAYLLGPRDAAPDAVAIAAVASRDWIGQLLRQTFRLDPTDTAHLAGELDRLTAFASAVPARRLTYPRDFDRLPAVLDAVLADLDE